MLEKQLQSYVGQKVLVKETNSVYHSKFSGDIPVTEYDVAEEDTIISKLESEVVAAKYQLRTWLPDTIGTMELRSDRINVHIAKQADGTFEITEIKVG